MIENVITSARPQFSANGSLQLYSGNLQAAAVTSFDQASHKQNLINYYNNAVAPDFANGGHFTNNGQKQSALSHLKNERNDTLKWVTDPALRSELVSLLDGVVAAVAK